MKGASFAGCEAGTCIETPVAGFVISADAANSAGKQPASLAAAAAATECTKHVSV